MKTSNLLNSLRVAVTQAERRLRLNTDWTKDSHLYQKVQEAKAKLEYHELIERLEWHDGGNGITNEVWKDPKTEKKYIICIEIVRDFDNLEEK